MAGGSSAHCFALVGKVVHTGSSFAGVVVGPHCVVQTFVFSASNFRGYRCHSYVFVLVV